MRLCPPGAVACLHDPCAPPLTRQAPPMRHLASLRLLLLALAGAAWLSGCALAPGGHMDYRTETAPLDDLVDIEPITPGLVATLRNGGSQAAAMPASLRAEIGRASCRERV